MTTAPRILLTQQLPADDHTSSLAEYRGYLNPRLSAEEMLTNSPNMQQNDRYVLQQYVNWSRFQPGFFLVPDLSKYRDFLFDTGLRPATVSIHVTTIRKRLEAIARDRDLLYSLIVQPMTLLEKKAVIDELVERIRNAVHPDATRVRIGVIQDVPDNEHQRLTKDQADELLRAPGVVTLLGLRDTAAIALALCTGIRERELVNLTVADLRQQLDGELALHVRNGKGGKTRMIPYGELVWCLQFVDAWLRSANIQLGAVFRRVFWYATEKHHKVRAETGHMHPGFLNDMLTRYPLVFDNKKVCVEAHDLRRTYARRCYEAGMDELRIQRNMGHVNLQVTRRYIGDLDGKLRRPPAAYAQPADLLAAVGA
ncbi:MAG: tyrosine-type recombinase/integrase [Chloroflexi bacterium]|uniref:tyrosine-type recombinase/integrase n=1 Tax=Candidatus Flexifilum breve TaxID=3140694 RepID=UPI003134CCBB|nr:tyrosine-type recombinase/integrase [Chloroflexota bacterium]